MKFKNSSGFLAALTIILTLGILIAWEFWLESLILVDYLDLTINKNSMDRWAFVVSCLAIVCLSLVLPFQSMKATNDKMKSLKAALQSEQALSKVFFSVDNSIILVIDNSNKIIQINNKTTNLLGFKEEELVGREWVSYLVTDTARDSIKKQYKHFVDDKNQNFIRFTAPIRSKDGQEKIVDWQCSPLKDEKGKVYGTINSGQDISEHIRLRGELTQMKSKYEPQIKKLTTELDFNKHKFHQETIKSAHARARFRFWLDLEAHLMGLPPKDRKDEKKVKAGIKKALQLFSDLSNADQGYVFKFTQDGSHMVNTQIWVAQEPLLEPDPDEEISLENYPWFKKKIQEKELIHIPKIQKMPKEASAEKEVYLSQGIKSLINAPILLNDTTIGYVGFEANQKEKSWDSDEISILKVVARLIADTMKPAPLEQPQTETPKTVSQKTTETMDSLELADIPELKLDGDSKQDGASLEDDLQKARQGAQDEVQKTLEKLESDHAKLQEELKERKQIEEDLRASQKEIESQLEEKSLQLEKLLTGAESGGGDSQLTMEDNLKKADMENKTIDSKPTLKTPGKTAPGADQQGESHSQELKKLEAELETMRTQLKTKTSGLTAKEVEEYKSKISEKDKELTSLRKSFDEEKATKTKLQKKLMAVKTTIAKHDEQVKSLQSANQALEAELEELRKLQTDFDNSSDQLEDTKQELENLEIANEQLMTDVEEKNFMIDEAKEKAKRYEQMDLPLFTLDQAGVILTWNKTAASLTGYISELALEEPISIMFAEKETFDFENEFLQPLREKSKLKIEVPIKKPNGTIFNALISLHSFKDRNEVLSTLGYMVNLSDASDEEEINAIKRQFTALLGNSGLILVNLSKDYQITDLNEKAESTFGWNKEAVLDKNFLETVLSDENWEEVFSDIQKRMDTQASVDLESKFAMGETEFGGKGETELSFLWNLVSEVNPKDQSVTGFLAIGQEVTDMRRAQDELEIAKEDLTRIKTDLKDNQFLLNLLVDKGTDGLITIDENGIVQSFNEGAENLFGYSTQEIVGQNVNRLMPDPYSKEHDNYIRKYLDAGQSNFVGGPPREFPAKKKDGSTFPCEITLREIYKGYQRVFVGITRDIRKRKESEIELVKIREKYNRFMDAESDPILIVDGSTQEILECNPAAPFFYGYDPKEFAKVSFKDLMGDENQSDNGDNPFASAGLGSTQRIPKTYQLKKDGTRFPVSMTTSSFRLNDTDYELKVIHDLSAEVSLEKQLQESNNRFEETIQEKQKEFEDSIREKQNQADEILRDIEEQKVSLRNEKLRTVEHITSSMVDLVNNPIQGIENILEQVKERAQMADIHKGLVTVAMNECRRVADLIGKLKNFQPPAQEDLESLDVHQVIDEILQSNMDIINDRTITLEKSYADDLPAVEAVTQQIRQAIDNIIKNAEESFTDDNGTITISTEQDGTHIKIHIQDTGCGIPEKDMDRIFDPFYTTKSAIHRSGLGLLASLGIVRNHKGEIDVDSRPGEGTTFTVTLPLKQPDEPSNGSA